MREIIALVGSIRFILGRHRFWVPGSSLREAPE